MALVLFCDSGSPFRDALERALESAGHRVRQVAAPLLVFEHHEAPRLRVVG